MAHTYQRALFVFRRDLRLVDNSALLAAHKMARAVLAAFIFDPRQVKAHPYFSSNALQFMLESLDELSCEIEKQGGRLHLLCGLPEKAIEELVKKARLQALFINRDYTPFSRKRDKALQALCRRLGIAFHCLGDSLLHEPEEVSKTQGGPYTIFTPFFNKASELPVRRPQKNDLKNFLALKDSAGQEQIFKEILPASNQHIAAHGGRKHALRILARLKEFKDYPLLRDFPACAGVTHLSPYNKFGVISVREFYYAIHEALGSKHLLIKQLFWRDFFTHIAFHFPHVFEGPFHTRYRHLEWSGRPEHFKAWAGGQTGFPLVDAGMRELNATGFMHNRVRMVTASFLVKDLHIDWRAGEKYFAAKLLDYDPAVNNGNWQWAASTGCDAQPYFRIFNPWLQQKKFDPQCEYIKRWVPELRNLSAHEIHRLAASSTAPPPGYPAPLVDHAVSSRRAQRMFEKVKE